MHLFVSYVHCEVMSTEVSQTANHSPTDDTSQQITHDKNKSLSTVNICHKKCLEVAFLTCVSHTVHVIDIGWTSVRPSHAGICVETAQPIVKLSSLPGSPMILVF